MMPMPMSIVPLANGSCGASEYDIGSASEHEFNTPWPGPPVGCMGASADSQGSAPGSDSDRRSHSHNLAQAASNLSSPFQCPHFEAEARASPNNLNEIRRFAESKAPVTAIFDFRTVDVAPSATNANGAVEPAILPPGHEKLTTFAQVLPLESSRLPNWGTIASREVFSYATTADMAPVQLRSGGGDGGGTGAAVRSDVLLPDWQATQLEDGRTYYWNSSTDETRWVPSPAHVATNAPDRVCSSNAAANLAQTAASNLRRMARTTKPAKAKILTCRPAGASSGACPTGSFATTDTSRP